MSIFSMAKTLFKSMASKPATVQYPLAPIVPFERSRGNVDIDIETCIFCGLCSKKCPTGAIKVDKPETLWAIDRLKCIQCNCCVEICPKKCLFMYNETPAVYSSDEKSKDVFIDARVSSHKADNKAD